MRLGFKHQYRTFDTKGEAEAWMRRVESEMGVGEWQDRSEVDRTTIEAALESCQGEVAVGKASSTTLVANV